MPACRSSRTPPIGRSQSAPSRSPGFSECHFYVAFLALILPLLLNRKFVLSKFARRLSLLLRSKNSGAWAPLPLRNSESFLVFVSSLPLLHQITEVAE